MATIQFTIAKQEGKYFATAGNVKFYIGSETVYEGNHGLYNYRLSDGPVYAPENYQDQFGYWAWFIYPTAMCESKGSFHCLNTYDRAAFTFTFMQYAAHVPNGDFVLYLRELLKLPAAKDYFPFLELKNDHVWYIRNQMASQLEDANSTSALMKYLNSDSNNIDDQELITAARFVHWAQNSEDHRNIQVTTAISLFKENMKEYDIRFNLDGWPDYVCHAICDILHQGRAKYSLIHNLLVSSDNRETVYTKLVNIGAEHYADRIKTLKSVHKRLRDQGIFGKFYNSANGEFN